MSSIASGKFIGSRTSKTTKTVAAIVSAKTLIRSIAPVTNKWEDFAKRTHGIAAIPSVVSVIKTSFQSEI